MGTLYTVSRSRPPIVMLNSWPGTNVGLESEPVDVFDDVVQGRDLVKLLHVRDIEVDVAELEDDELADEFMVIETFQGIEPFCDGHDGSYDEDTFWLGQGSAELVKDGVAPPAAADPPGAPAAALPAGPVAAASNDGPAGGEGVASEDPDGDEGGCPSPS